MINASQLSHIFGGYGMQRFCWAKNFLVKHRKMSDRNIISIIPNEMDSGPNEMVRFPNVKEKGTYSPKF